MSMHRITRIGAALIVVAGLAVAAPAGATRPDDHRPGDARTEHQRIIDFWTADRIRSAVPRDFLFDPGTGRLVPRKPGKGGGRPGGGGGSGGVTGASWTGGGLVVTTTGKVFFELAGTLYVCSGGLVEDPADNARSLVLTAAHCVYDNETGAVATNWMFIPDYDAAPSPLDAEGTFCASTEYGCWTAETLVLHDGFASAGGFNATAVQYDFAFAVLGEGGLDGATLAESLGTQAIQFVDVAKGTFVDAFGYPHAAPYDGTDLTYCAGKVGFDRRLANLTYELRCDMTGGSSGGPWFVGFDDTSGSGTVTSLNSYGYLGKTAMYGPKFNATTNAVYDAAVVTDTTTPVVVVP